MTEKNIPMIKATKTAQKDVTLDPAGFFVIMVQNDRILVESYENVVKQGQIVSGKLRRVFTGNRADALCDTIASYEKDLLPEHYCYLGRELIRAQKALEHDVPYVQGGC